jgi:hypothetical protein
MYGLLSVLAICIALLFAINSLQNKPITFIIHKKFENVAQPAKPLTEEEKQFLEEQKQTIDGMNEVIRITQEFLGGDVEDADAKR